MTDWLLQALESNLTSLGAHFRDLFGSRFGAVGICGGYGLFDPRASLPCHVHQYDESITIVRGQAVSPVPGRRSCWKDGRIAS